MMMQFVLTGFTHEKEFRVFAFARMGEDRVQTHCTVRADLALVRRYGIHLQELPLLCRTLLDRGEEATESRALTFTEEEMQVCANERTARQGAAKKRKPPVRPAGETVGAAWRGPQL
jgi:hypothetical protein